MTTDALPGWLEAELLEGLAGLFLLRLDGTPAAELQEAIANLWIAAVATRGKKWSKEVDGGHIAQAFRVMYASCDRWPAPKQLLDVLRDIEAQASSQLRLAAPPLTEAEKRYGREMLRHMQAHLEGFVGPKQPLPAFTSRADFDKYLDEQAAPRPKE